MSDVRWWRRYGDYPPGRHNLPHMGAVLSEYRQRRGYSRAEVAQALEVKQQTVSYWEATMYLADPERRILLARLLQIPPALLGLAWEQVVFVSREGEPGASYERLAEVVSLEGYYHFEDLFVLANQLQYAGQLRWLAERMPRWLGKLRQKVKEAPASERDAWLWLQGLYLHMTAWLASHQPEAAQTRSALNLTLELLGLARELDDPTLTGLAFFHLAHRHLEVGDRTSAGAAAWEGLRWVKRVGPALGGQSIPAGGDGAGAGRRGGRAAVERLAGGGAPAGGASGRRRRGQLAIEAEPGGGAS
ncbi:helix-turn-helix transcriptional regulator [Thermogemmatispora tikiterensis]|uniref:HTH cro/C1-type domain-containing protein n=1 Tax=Thermogemmatispora tikiterensis TaxID=1825093 RepID=A0A328VID9_9CHLR|nr:helix-turn-helix transcriptional regulator [Thermogemmatispora tikiterensis]RAQ97217.1 hypothetical protein A4R35_16885 [Thermogemmatispora tikiterensis]